MRSAKGWLLLLALIAVAGCGEPAPKPATQEERQAFGGRALTPEEMRMAEESAKSMGGPPQPQ